MVRLASVLLSVLVLVPFPVFAGAAAPLCGDGDNDEEIDATDALLSLKAAVGSQECALCLCDVNGSADLTAVDSLIVLKVAVGQDLETSCPPCEPPTTTSTLLATTTTLPATTTTLPAVADVVINEVTPDPVADADWIELFNAGTAAADLGGWFMTDSDPSEPFFISAGTMLAPGAYLVFERDAAGSFTFGLSATSDEVHLYDGDAVEIDSTAWGEGDASSPTSWGRLPDGTGPFSTRSVPTKGTANQ